MAVLLKRIDVEKTSIPIVETSMTVSWVFSKPFIQDILEGFNT